MIGCTCTLSAILPILLQYVATNARQFRWFGGYRHHNLSSSGSLYITFRFIPFISTISYKSIMSSESSFDGQTFNEFDDFLPKPLSTDSESDHVDPEPTGATISSQAPLTSVPISSQTSMVPSTPGISESFFSLEIAPVQSTDCSRARKRMGSPHKRIYARRLTVGISNTREDASAKLQDLLPK